MHPLCRLYTQTCKASQCSICSACKNPVSYAELTDEQKKTFQAILDSREGDPEETFLHSRLMKTRKDAEAFMNYLWPKQNSYPLMFRLLEDILIKLNTK